MQDVTNEIVQAINQYGFPTVAAMGMGYFVFYVWKWATTIVKPVLGEASTTLIKLVDRIRMLDNDMIRLNTKLAMVLEYKEEIEKNSGRKIDEDLEDILKRNKSFSQGFNSTGKPDTPKTETKK